LLHTNEFEGTDTVPIFQAQLNHFPSALHERVEVLGLGMTSAQGGNGGDVIAVFVTLNDDRKLALGFHNAILARGNGLGATDGHAGNALQLLGIFKT
jgi:hypothetical protein